MRSKKKDKAGKEADLQRKAEEEAKLKAEEAKAQARTAEEQKKRAEEEAKLKAIQDRKKWLRRQMRIRLWAWVYPVLFLNEAKKRVKIKRDAVYEVFSSQLGQNLEAVKAYLIETLAPYLKIVHLVRACLGVVL
jgi:hypothetical protein